MGGKHRRLRAGEGTAALDEAGDMTAEAVDLASAIEQAEVRQFVRDAIAGLNPSERDVIELSLVQGLEADELADALGVSRNHAHALVSRPAASWSDPSARCWSRGPAGSPAPHSTPCSPDGTGR